MSTKLGVYNLTLLELKQRKLTALTDNNVARRTLDDHWDSTVEWMIAEASWNFAVRSVAIEHSEDVEPEFGFTYAIEQPSDYVRLVSIAANGDFWPTLDRYHIDTLAGTTYWHTFVDPLYVRYVSNDTDYGWNLGRWTPSFERALVMQLACRAAPHITAMGADVLAGMEKRASRDLRNAKTKDAIEQMADRPPPGRLVSARINGSRMARRSRGLWDDT